MAVVSRKIRVLYCTVVPIGQEESGGSIVCREHVRRLASNQSLDVHVCAIGDKAHVASGQTYSESLGVKFHGIALRSGTSQYRPPWPSRRWPYMFERLAWAQPQVDDCFARLLIDLQPDVTVVDYLLTALFVPSVFQHKSRLVTVTLNREATFYRELLRLGRLPLDASRSIFAAWRLRRFERAVYRASDAVVALSRGDVPKRLGTTVHTSVIEPLLEDRADRWQFRGTSQLFYVGNIAHYPNYLAIQWIAERFAPLLKSAAPHARIAIIGASQNDVPKNWLQQNIDYLGASSKQEVITRLTQCDLFLAPIENNFGAKIKILECLAHGTPIMASPGALSGVAFANVIPQFSLDDPQSAVAIALQMIGAKERLTHLSASLLDESARLHRTRDELWMELVQKIVKVPPRDRRRSLLFSPLRSPIYGRQPPWPSLFEVGVEEPIGVETSGMFPIEIFEGRRIRWATDRASIFVRLDRRFRPKKMNLVILGIAPPTGTNFRVLVDGKDVLNGRIHDKRLEKSVRLPDLTDSDSLKIDLESTGFNSPGDGRILGVAIESVMLVR